MSDLRNVVCYILSRTIAKIKAATAINRKTNSGYVIEKTDGICYNMYDYTNYMRHIYD